MSQSNQPGKRYTCERCGTQVMCVRPGKGSFSCHGEPMSIIEAKPLPSSD